MHTTRSAVDAGLELSSLNELLVVESNWHGQNVAGEGCISKMSQSIPYSQPENGRDHQHHHHHHHTFHADRRYSQPHQYHHHVNGYFGSRAVHYKSPYNQRQFSHFPSHPTASAGSETKRKFEISPSESSTSTKRKVEIQGCCNGKEFQSTSNVQGLASSFHAPRTYESNPTNKNQHFYENYRPAESANNALQTGETEESPNEEEKKSASNNTRGLVCNFHVRPYERNPPPNKISSTAYETQSYRHAYSERHYERRHSWQLASQNHCYQNENSPPSRTSQRDLACKGCMVGKDAIHLKLFHSVLTQAIYSNISKVQDVMAQQIPGCSFVHDGLCFGFEKNSNSGDKWMVVRGTGCLGMASPNGSSKCQICQRQQSHVDGIMQATMSTHAEPPERMCRTASIDEIKMVPTLAEMKMRQMKCEIEDYKENSITVVNV